MNLRRTAAATVLTIGLVLGGTTAAFADTPPSHPPASAACKAAAHELHQLRVLDARLRADYAKLVKVRNAAEKAGRTELVKKIDVRLAKLRTAHARAVAQVKKVAATVRAECTPSTAAA